MLQAQGLLTRRQGDGTYVSDRKIERQAGQPSPSPSACARRASRRARGWSRSKASGWCCTAAALHLPTSPVYDIRRLRFLNEQPVLLEHYTLSGARFPQLSDHDFEQNSLYEILHEHYGVDVNRARLSLEAVLAAPFEAEQLLVPHGAPLLLERRLSYDAQGAPVEHGEDYYRGDRFQFVTETAALAL
jgi:GntR family transcriptional regulator